METFNDTGLKGQKDWSTGSKLSHNDQQTILTLEVCIGNRKTQGDSYLNKLYREFPIKSGNFAMHTQFSSFYRERHYFIMSRAVTHTVKDIQILHHNMAI